MGAPSLLDAQAQQAIERLNAITERGYKGLAGALISDGGTTQATGANGTLNFDADASLLAQGDIAGVPHTLVAATDVDSDAGDSVAWGALTGKSVIFAVVLSSGADNDTPVYIGVPGAVADDGEEVAPDSDAIDTAVGDSNWALAAHMTVQRTGDTAVTVTVDNSARSMVNFAAALSETEREFQS